MVLGYMVSVDLNKKGVKIVCALKRIGVPSKGEVDGSNMVMMVYGQVRCGSSWLTW